MLFTLSNNGSHLEKQVPVDMAAVAIAIAMVK